MSSDSRVTVIRVPTPRRHDNADTLSIVDVHGGYPCIIRTGDFVEGALATYIPVDMLVPDTDTFKFLRSKSSKPGSPIRIKAKRLRGVFSMGVLVKAPDSAAEGDDVTDLLGITKYEPDIEVDRGPSRPGGKFLPGDAEPDPGIVPAYTDIENLRKWRSVLDGDEVVVTEKIHGANAGFVFAAKGSDAPRLWVRSRRQFKKPDGGGIWADVAAKYCFAEVLAAVCPNIAIFGEVYGQVQDLTYAKGSDVDLVAFDAMDTVSRRYLDYDDFVNVVKDINMVLSCEHYPNASQLKVAPVLYRGTYDYAAIAALAEGATLLGGGLHVREGVVVKPLTERWHDRLGRIILKLAGEGYLTR